MLLRRLFAPINSQVITHSLASLAEYPTHLCREKLPSLIHRSHKKLVKIYININKVLTKVLSRSQIPHALSLAETDLKLLPKPHRNLFVVSSDRSLHVSSNLSAILQSPILGLEVVDVACGWIGLIQLVVIVEIKERLNRDVFDGEVLRPGFVGGIGYVAVDGRAETRVGASVFDILKVACSLLVRVY